MDEISYWIYTKRAPCLMNYDNAKKMSEEAQSSKIKPESVLGVTEVPSPKKKKKRKLSLLEEESTSDVQANVYFDTSFKQKRVVPSCKSDTLRSDVDFNIRNVSLTEKSKKNKLQKAHPVMQKKTRVVTSTPKVSTLRRSVRQARRSHNNNSQLNSSFELLDTSVINGNHINSNVEHKSPEKLKIPTERLADGDHTDNNKRNAVVHKFPKPKHDVLNGQFEDLSDVSGFTANYIRSTKIQSKTPKKLRCKNNRTLVKESQHSEPKDSNMVVCMNKSVNTPTKPTALNCSTDSENIINLVTNTSNENTTKLSKRTSLLKFMESRNCSRKDTGNSKLNSSKRQSKGNHNVSFHSQSPPSRYPKRYRNHNTSQDVTEENMDTSQCDKKRRITKNSHVFNNSDRKENPDNNVSKTRSGKNIGLTVRQPENAVLVLSNSTEHVSSMVSMNVASPVTESKGKVKRKKRNTRHLRSNKSADRRASLQKDSARDKSGFAACFSDSDDDSEPLQRKFFCT